MLQWKHLFKNPGRLRRTKFYKLELEFGKKVEKSNINYSSSRNDTGRHGHVLVAH